MTLRTTGSLPFFAQVSTESGSKSLFTVHEVSVTRGIFKKDLVTTPVTLSVNEKTGSHTDIELTSASFVT